MTEQAEAGRPGGARSLAEWCLCLNVVKGRSDEVSKETARGTIQNTPREKRTEFAREIARRRRTNGNDRPAAKF